MLLPNFLVQSILRNLKIALGVISVVALASPAAAEIHRLNSDEMTLFKRVTSCAGQKREILTLDPVLCKVARQRGADMAHRHYFGHVNPNGQGPNFLVRRAGFILPIEYDRSLAGNNIESIGMSAGSPKEMVSLWLNSSAHRSHILAELSFYQKQTAVGVGVYRSSQAPYYKYFVFLSAPPAATTLASAMILKSPKGVILSTTRPIASALAQFVGATGE